MKPSAVDAAAAAAAAALHASAALHTALTSGRMPDRLLASAAVHSKYADSASDAREEGKAAEVAAPGGPTDVAPVGDSLPLLRSIAAAILVVLLLVLVLAALLLAPTRLLNSASSSSGSTKRAS